MNVRVRLLLATLAVACRPVHPGDPTPEPATTPADGPTRVGSDEPTLAEAAAPRRGAGWSAEIDEDGGIRVRHAHADVIRSRHVLFTQGFRWAEPEFTVETGPDDGARLGIVAKPLGLRGTVVYARDPDRSASLRASYQLALERALQGISGGGLELDVDLTPALWGGRTPTIAIADDRRRATIGTAAASIELRLAGDGFGFIRENGAPGRIRAILLADDVPARSRTATITLALPDGGEIRAPTITRYRRGTARDKRTWTPELVAWDGWPVDVGALFERPAGQHGRLRAEADTLVFDDGTPARLWGTTIAASTLFGSDKDAIERQARRIAAFGYNLVRLHHHDSAWVDPNVFERGSAELRDASLDALDWWIHCLQREGVYVWLDLHVGRTFTRADAIGGFAEIEGGDVRGFSYVNPRIEKLMQRFAEQYLERRNRYTGRTLTDDPAIAAVLVTNENDITHHFGQNMLPGSGRPVHEALLRDRLQPFARAHGLAIERLLRTWEPGPAKLALGDLEHAWGRRQVAALRAMGVRVPIAVTSVWGDDPLYCVPSQLAGDVIDVHSYGGPDALSQNPHVAANFVAWANLGNVLGRPHTLSEWNVPIPARDRASAPLYVAAIAALQGWDAPMLYAHSQDPLQPPGWISQFSSGLDPAIAALMPAAAVIARRGDVAVARTTIVLRPSSDVLWGEARTPANSAALRTGVERARVVIAIPDDPRIDWDGGPEPPRGATIVRDLDRDLLPAGGNAVRSDTGELVRDWALGRFAIDTPRSDAVMGWIGGERVAVGEGWVELAAPTAAFALTALDDEPLGDSARILVSAAGQAEPQPGGPFVSEPMTGRFAIRSSRALELVPLSATAGSAGVDLDGRVPTRPTREGDLQVFTLPRAVPTHWWILRPARPAGAAPSAGGAPPAPTPR